jgi:predicted PurR-regulated permease PerM
MQRQDYARIGFVAALLVVAYYALRILMPFLTGLVWAAILAIVFYPAYERLARWVKRPSLASALTCLLLVVMIILPVLLIVVLLAGESVQAYGVVEAKLQSGNVSGLEWVRETAAFAWLRGKLLALGLPEPNLSKAVVETVGSISQFLVRHSSDVFSGFAHSVFNFLVMILGTYYMFLSGPSILAEIRRLSPLRPEHEEAILNKFKEITVATFVGNLLTALLQGTAGGLVFLLFGLDAPLLWGAVMAFLSLVPLVGTALVWGPVVIYFVLTGSVLKGLLLLVVSATVVSSIDNLVKPLLIRRGVEIPTAWVFVGVLGGVAVFGFLGVVLGPLVIAILLALFEIYKTQSRGEVGGKLFT